jgi:maltose/moltooligosaccharide transporter
VNRKNYEETEKQPGMLASLGEVWRDHERSALRILLAIFFWFLGYNAIEAFFTLYAVNHLGIDEADGALLLGQLSFVFVLFALPAGYIGGAAGRKPTILTGITLLTMTTLMVFFLPRALLTQELTTLPVLGMVPVMGALLMVSGAAWALININSLPMVVDMTTAARLGTFTGLYYLFSTLSAITGPIVNGVAIQLTGGNYNIIWILAPVFMAIALVMMIGVRRGEAAPLEAAQPA